MEASNQDTEAIAETKEPLVEQILLFKTSEQRWGFRLTGGADFGTPITVIKVTAGGVAASAGLRVGDLLLGVDEVSLATMTHDAASKLVLDRGDKLTVTLVRGTFEMPALPPRQTPGLQEPTPAAPTAAPILGEPLAPEELPPLLAQIINEGDQLNQPIAEPLGESLPITELQETAGEPAGPIRELSEPNSEQTGPITEAKEQDSTLAPEQGDVPQAEALAEGEGVEGEAPRVEYTEEEIAEMISGCAEVLQGSCIGVDFQKLPPDTDIMKSKVLDAILTEKLGPPPKKPTTFNQKPTNPRPKTKQELEPRPPPYNPLKYVPQKKKEENPPEQPVTEQTPAPQCETEQATETPEAPEPSEQAEPFAELQEPTEQPSEVTEEEEQQVAEEEQAAKEEQVVASTELEQQLGEIQRQLAAIIQLPAEIQQHLTFIQEQLAKVLAQRKAEEEAVEQEAVEQEALEQQEGEPIVEEPVEEEAAEAAAAEAEEVCEEVEAEPAEQVPEEPVEEVPEVPEIMPKFGNKIVDVQTPLLTTSDPSTRRPIVSCPRAAAPRAEARHRLGQATPAPATPVLPADPGAPTAAPARRARLVGAPGCLHRAVHRRHAQRTRGAPRRRAHVGRGLPQVRPRLRAPEELARVRDGARAGGRPHATAAQAQQGARGAGLRNSDVCRTLSGRSRRSWLPI